MAVFLLTWNPEYWSLHTTVAELAARGEAADNWRTQSRKVKAGDVVLLLRQGEEPRGIVGVGRATGIPLYIKASYDDRFRWYVPLVWTQLEPEAPLVPQAKLKTLIPTANWSPRCSGTRVPDVEAAVLMDLLNPNL